jgi:hypothetical protein
MTACNSSNQKWSTYLQQFHINIKYKIGISNRVVDCLSRPPVATLTTKVWSSELEEPEEGEHLFHSQMWVKGALIHLIVNSNSQKNLISIEVGKRLDLPMTLHPQPYTISWLRQGRDLCVNQQCRLPY